jgi:Flp pilus assembly pilin Flp
MARKFWAQEDGAVTVDWVVVTALIVGLGFAILNVVGGALNTQSEAIGDKYTEIGIKTTFGN